MTKLHRFNSEQKEFRLWTYLDVACPSLTETEYSDRKDDGNSLVYPNMLLRLLQSKILMYPMRFVDTDISLSRTENLVETAKIWETSGKRNVFLA